MKPNTYVKIVSSGIVNPVEELMPFIQGEEIMPLQEDESVEVRSSVFNEGNIIIFRNRKSREVLSVIHTPHTVYIQEQNKTISTHRPYTPFLFGMDDTGKMEAVAQLFEIKLPGKFYLEASQELQEIAAYVTSVLEQLNPSIIDMTIEFDRFNLPCRKNVGMEPAFAYLNEALQEKVGYVLMPVKAGPGHRTAIDYFYLEPIQETLHIELDKNETDPVGKVKEIQESFNAARGPGELSPLDRGFLKSVEDGIGKAPMTDLTMGGQMGSIPKPDVNDQRTWLIDPDTKMPVHPDSSQGVALYNAAFNQGK